MIAGLHALLADFGDDVEITVVRSGEPTESPIGTPMWAAMERAAQRAYPGCAPPRRARSPARPMRGGSGRPACPSYGFGLLSRSITPTEYWSRFHGNDERVDVESLRLSSEMWEQLAATSSNDER